MPSSTDICDTRLLAPTLIIMASEGVGNYAQTLDQAVGYGVVGEYSSDYP